MKIELLKKPFREDEIEWRIGRSGMTGSGKPWAMCLAYVTSRAIMDRLDDVCGPANWKDEYFPMEIAGAGGDVVSGIKCRLSIYLEEPYGWVAKEDGAQCTNIESFKGGLSDSLKRAAVKWGIGRYLYNLEEGWATISEHRTDKAQKVKIEGKWFFWTPPALPTWAISDDDLFQE